MYSILEHSYYDKGERMIDVMIDIETFGTGIYPVIASIGAVRFDLDTGEMGEEFYTNIDVDSQVKAGFVMEGATVEWWMKQSDEARKALFEPEPLHTLKALELFAKYLREVNKTCVWGNGSNFDNRIVRNAYNKLSMTAPWHYRDDRDVRTLVALGRSMGVNTKSEQIFEGTAHNALDDARNQVKYCVHTWKQIRERS